MLSGLTCCIIVSLTPLTSFAKPSILDVCQGCEYTSVLHNQFHQRNVFFILLVKDYFNGSFNKTEIVRGYIAEFCCSK